MAFGLTPHFSQDISLDGLDPSQFLALCVNTAHARNWSIRHISDAGVIALTSDKMFKRKQKVTIRISGDLAQLRSESTGNEMIDWGSNRKNIEQFTATLDEGRTNASPEELTRAYEELKPNLVPPEQDILVQPKGKSGGFLSLLIPRQGFYVTPILIDINLAIYVLMVVFGVNAMQPSTADLVNWGANIRLLTLDGQWWRIITCMFIHIGILHVLMNMYALLFIGLLLEPQLGKVRFLGAYLLTGIAASVASLYWHANVLSAGASGAIFGMYGVFLALLTTNLIDKARRTPLLTSIAIFIFYNLAYGTKAGVDNAAHVGGLMSGILIGYLYYPGLKNAGRPMLRYSGLAVASLLVLAVTVTAFQKIPNDYPVYQRKMEAFTRLERQALGTFDPQRNFLDPARLNAIRDTGIRNWNVSIRILNQAGQLDVGEPLKKRTTTLIRYCNLRILSFNYIYKKMSDSAGAAGGVDSVAYYNSAISDLIDSLKDGK